MQPRVAKSTGVERPPPRHQPHCVVGDTSGRHRRNSAVDAGVAIEIQGRWPVLGRQRGFGSQRPRGSGPGDGVATADAEARRPGFIRALASWLCRPRIRSARMAPLEQRSLPGSRHRGPRDRNGDLPLVRVRGPPVGKPPFSSTRHRSSIRSSRTSEINGRGHWSRCRWGCLALAPPVTQARPT